MSVLSGIARLLNPFAWLRSSKKVEQTAQHEYEFQEEEEPEPIEEAPSAQPLSESDVENHLREGDFSEIHGNRTSDIHSDGCQEQMGGDVFLGTAKENEESSLESSDKIGEPDSVENPTLLDLERSSPTESKTLQCEVKLKSEFDKYFPTSKGDIVSSVATDGLRQDPDTETNPQSVKSMVVSTQQGLFFGAPTSNESPREEVESRCGISDMTLEGSDKPMLSQDTGNKMNMLYETTSIKNGGPSTIGSSINDGNTGIDEHSAVSSREGDGTPEDTLVIVKPPCTIKISPKVLQYANKRRARDDAEVVPEYENLATQQPWKVKQPRRSYNVSATKNLHLTESPSPPATPANTPIHHSSKARSKAEKNRNV